MHITSAQKSFVSTQTASGSNTQDTQDLTLISPERQAVLTPLISSQFSNPEIIGEKDDRVFFSSKGSIKSISQQELQDFQTLQMQKGF